MINAKWVKCKTDVWCTLKTVNLTPIKTVGVYLIWDSEGRPIRLGQGVIADRLEEHRNNPEIMKYGNDLLVTWASIPARQMDGVENYLEQQYSPLVGERFPSATPISVNLPKG